MQQATDSTIVHALGPITADVLLALHAAHPQRYPVLLESSAASLQGHNYDLLLAFPIAHLTLRGHTLSSSAELHLNESARFLSALDEWWQRERIVTTASPLPFVGGWFLYLAYELAAEIEPTLHAKLSIAADQLRALALRIPAAIVRERHSQQAWLVVETQPTANAWHNLVRSDLQHHGRLPAYDLQIDQLREDPPQQFATAVQAALDHIAAGDIYQANLSRGWQAHCDGTHHHSALAVYQALRQRNPAPFSGIARLGEQHTLISSSPERLLSLREGEASTRPIAGTRPRHADAAQDAAMVAELQAHPKERAEHIMLLDLERNDLGRICVGGSVQVDEYMSIESYAHVHHIVSNVRGEPRPSVTPGEAIAAVFPGGTITGCPKVRCMEIIAEQEGVARGAYTGSMGYLNRDGSMDLNILIRTFELNEQRLQFRAGAGIVADSQPHKELEETRAKALGLLRALQA